MDRAPVVKSTRTRKATIAASLDSPHLRSFWEIYDRNFERLVEELLVVIREDPELAPMLDVQGEDAVWPEARESRALMREAVVNGDWTPYLQKLDEQGQMYAQAGIDFESWFKVVTLMRRAVVPIFLTDLGGDAVALANTFLGLDDLMDIALARVGRSYLNEQTRIILAQQEAITELSTPVLQLDDRLLVLPIVGVLDTHRARTLTEQLLARIRTSRSLVVVLDITGVVGVDTKVANHLIQTINAAKLMGTTSVLTGVSPDVAQTLVSLGIELGMVRTAADLQAGVEFARGILAAARLDHPSAPSVSRSAGRRPAEEADR